MVSPFPFSKNNFKKFSSIFSSWSEKEAKSKVSQEEQVGLTAEKKKQAVEHHRST